MEERSVVRAMPPEVVTLSGPMISACPAITAKRIAIAVSATTLLRLSRSTAERTVVEIPSAVSRGESTTRSRRCGAAALALISSSSPSNSFSFNPSPSARTTIGPATPSPWRSMPARPWLTVTTADGALNSP